MVSGLRREPCAYLVLRCQVTHLRPLVVLSVPSSCVCGDGDCEDDDQIIFCDRCDIAVHQICYGVSAVPEGEWYCAPCSMLISRGFIKQTPMSPQYTCAVCWQKGGAMRRLLIEKQHYKKTLQLLNSGDGKPPAQLTFAHLACAMWLGELYLLDTDEMTPICGLHTVNPQRFKLKCALCKVPGGACVQCSEKKCCVAYHMQCALEHGLQLDTVNDTSKECGSSYITWCEKHRNTPRMNTVLKAIEGQVQGAVPQCQVCCYNVSPQEITGMSNDMLCCTSCNLQVHQWCYGTEMKSAPTTRSSPSSMKIELITDEESKSAEQPMTLTNGVESAAAPVVPAAPSAVRKFLCRVCEWSERATASSNGASGHESPACALCLATQGALKITDDGRWVCLVSDALT
jgi:hypothetical protein